MSSVIRNKVATERLQDNKTNSEIYKVTTRDMIKKKSHCETKTKTS